MCTEGQLCDTKPFCLFVEHSADSCDPTLLSDQYSHSSTIPGDFTLTNNYQNNTEQIGNVPV